MNFYFRHFVKKSKYNELLYIAIIVLIFALLFRTILDYYNLLNASSKYENTFGNLEISMIFFGGILAPVIEEIVFRGLFAKKRLQILFCVGVGVYIYLLSNYYLLPLALLFLVLFNKKSINFSFVIILNSIIFGAMHYSLADFIMPANIFSFLMKFGLSLFLSWIVFNFGLKYSILVHVCINFSVISLLILKFGFSSKSEFSCESADYTMKYQRVSILNSDSKIRSDDTTYVIMSNSSIYDLQKYLCNKKELTGVYLGKFNITIQRKKGSTRNIDCAIVQELLMKSNIESL